MKRQRCFSLNEKITYGDLDVKHDVHGSMIQRCWYEQCRADYSALFHSVFISCFNKDGSERLDHLKRLNCTY